MQINFAMYHAAPRSYPLLMLAACLLAYGCGQDADAHEDDASVAFSDPTASDYIFDDDVIRHYDITLDPADWEWLQRFAVKEQYVSAMLTFEGHEYGPVGLRFKGFRGSLYNCFQCCSTSDTRVECPEQACYDDDGVIAASSCSRLNLKLSFTEYGDVDFHSLRRLNFHAMNSDNSFVRERLGYWMFRTFDVQAPRAVYASVSVNGQSQGVYSVVEQVDRSFATRRFDDGGGGNIYKERWPMTSTDEAYFVGGRRSAGTGPASVAPMVEFARALGEAAPQEMRAILREHTDYDALMRHLAVDRAIGHFDGVMMFRCRYEDEIAVLPQDIHDAQRPPLPWEVCQNKNFFWYENTQTGRELLVPWDMDYTFQPVTEPSWTAEPGPGECDVAPSGRPAGCDPLIRALATEMYDDYQVAGRQLLAEVFQQAEVRALIEQWAQQLRANEHAVAAGQDPTALAIVLLRSIVDQRRADFAREVGGI